MPGSRVRVPPLLFVQRAYSAKRYTPSVFPMPVAPKRFSRTVADMRITTHPEKHRSERIGWLRAAVLGANDGIVSTASLIVGVAAAASSRAAVLLAGVAGLVAGAMSMAAGEYVSVSSQADTEAADLERERSELKNDPEFEH